MPEGTTPDPAPGGPPALGEGPGPFFEEYPFTQASTDEPTTIIVDGVQIGIHPMLDVRDSDIRFGDLVGTNEQERVTRAPVMRVIRTSDGSVLQDVSLIEVDMRRVRDETDCSFLRVSQSHRLDMFGPGPIFRTILARTAEGAGGLLISRLQQSSAARQLDQFQRLMAADMPLETGRAVSQVNQIARAVSQVNLTGRLGFSRYLIETVNPYLPTINPRSYMPPLHAREYVETPEAREEREERQERARREREERELIRRRRTEKSEELLKLLLGKKELKRWRKDECVIIKGSHGTRYRIERGTDGNVFAIDDEGKELGRFCAHPDEWLSDGGLPPADMVVGQALALMTDEPYFFNHANVYRGQVPQAVREDTQSTHGFSMLRYR